MTDPADTDRGRSLVVRWRILAARRLDHLIELFQSGRWKLYYQEADFLKLVQEARTVLKTWEALAPPDPVQDKVAEVEIAQAADDLPGALPLSADDIAAEDDLRKS